MADPAQTAADAPEAEAEKPALAASELVFFDEDEDEVRELMMAKLRFQHLSTLTQ